MLKASLSNKEKGLTMEEFKDDVEEILMKEHDPMNIGDDYIVGIFGSAFASLRMSIIS